MEYPLKTIRASHRPGDTAIYTEYDLPREEIAPHDTIVGKDGTVWFSSFGEQNSAGLDPLTGKVTEFPYPKHREDATDRQVSGLRADSCGQSVARQHVPGDDRQIRSQDRENSSSGRCRPRRTSTPRRSTW